MTPDYLEILKQDEEICHILESLNDEEKQEFLKWIPPPSFSDDDIP